MSHFVVETGGIKDLDLLVRHRLKMWEAIFPEKTADIQSAEEQTRKWIRDTIQRGALIPFIARTDEGDVAGSGCVLIREDQPRPSSDQVYNPYLLSVYTEKDFRKKGVATRILEESIRWSKDRGFDRMILHASPEGRSLYEKAGFTATNEMRLWF